MKLWRAFAIFVLTGIILEDSAAAEQTTIRLAAGQIVCRPGDFEGNLKQIERLSRQAADARARLCLFAEGAITG